MAKCEICSKDMMFGRHISITRSQVSRRAKRNWKVNVRRVKIVDAKGVTRYAYVCASCLKSGSVTRAVKAPKTAVAEAAAV
ncbi:MAG: mitochondrial large ribosomal subunit protein bL28m [Clostridia bacterium]|nr:mitochondrial large ribosomal subunit protein bL28m [Clostridia bacterium]